MRKRFFYPAIFLIILGFVIYVVVESEKINLLNTFIPEKIAVFENVHMSGEYGSHEAWEIYAKEAWTGRDRSSTTFEHVTKAVIYRDGRKMIRDLKARRMTIRKDKNIETFRSVDRDSVKYLKAVIDFNAVSNRHTTEAKLVTLTADRISFNPDRKKAVVEGAVKLTKDKLTVTTESVSLDLDMNTAFFPRRSYFKKEGSRISCATAEALFDEDRAFMYGSIEVEQKNKKATSLRAEYDDDGRSITLQDSVEVVIEKLKNVMKKESVERYKSDEARKSLETRTLVSCNRLVISTDSGDAQAYGNVHVTQSSKEARSDKATYAEDDQNIVLTGNVFMKRGSDWVKADKVVVSVDKDIFEAIGQVETEFKVKKGKREY